MASDLSKYLGNKIARWLGGATMPSAPANIYVAIFDGDPRSGGTEVTTDIISSGRVAPTWTVPASNDTDNELVNDSDCDFGLSEGAVDASHVAIFDASTSGNMLGADELPGGPFSIIIGQAIKFEAGNLSFVIGR